MSYADCRSLVDRLTGEPQTVGGANVGIAPAVRRLVDRLHDACWSSPQARDRGMSSLVDAARGSDSCRGRLGGLNEAEFARRVARLAVRSCIPTALRALALRRARPDRPPLLRAADLCERKPTRAHVREARAAVHYAASADDYAAAAVAYADAAYAFSAAGYGPWYDGRYPIACGDSAYAAAAAADASAHAAASSANLDPAYANVANASAVAADDALTAFVDGVVRILSDLKDPNKGYVIECDYER